MATEPTICQTGFRDHRAEWRLWIGVCLTMYPLMEGMCLDIRDRYIVRGLGLRRSISAALDSTPRSELSVIRCQSH